MGVVASVPFVCSIIGVLVDGDLFDYLIRKGIQEKLLIGMLFIQFKVKKMFVE